MGEFVGGIGPLSPLQELLKEKEALLRQKESEHGELQEMCKQFMEENETLKAAIREKNAELNNMEKKLLEVVDKSKNGNVPKTEYETIIKESTALKLKVSSLEDENKSKSDKMKQSQSLIDELEKTNGELVKALEATKKEAEDLKAVTNALEESHKSMFDEVNKLRSDNREVHQKADRLQGQIQAIPKGAWSNDSSIVMEIFFPRLSDLNAQLGKKMAEGSNFVEIGEIGGADREDEQGGIAGTLGYKTLLESSFDIYEGNLNSIFQALEEAQDRIKDREGLLDEINRLRTELNTKDEQITTAINDLDRVKMDRLDELNAMKSQITELETKSRIKDQLLEEMQSRLDKKESMIGEESARSVKLMADVVRGKEEMEKSKTQLDTLHKENVSLKEQINQQDMDLDDIEILRDEIENQKRTIKTLHGENYELKKHLIEAKQKHSRDVEERQIVAGNVDKLNREIRELFSEMANERSKDATATENQLQLTKRNLELKSEYDKISTQLEDYKNSCTHLKRRCESLETSLRNAEAERNELLTKASNVTDRVSKMMQETVQLSSKSRDLENETTTLRSELNQANSRVAEANSANQTMSFDLQQKHTDIQLLLGNRNRMMEEANMLRTSIENLKVANQQITQMKESAEKNFHSIKEQYDAMIQKEDAERRESARIRTEVLGLMDRNDRLAEANKREKQRYRELQTQFSRLSQEFEVIQRKAIMQERDSMNLDESITTLQAALDTTTKKYERRLDSKQAEVDGCRKKIDTLNDTVDSKNKEIEELKSMSGPLVPMNIPEGASIGTSGSARTGSQSTPRSRVTNFDTILANAHQTLLKENRKLKQDLAHKQILEMNLQSQMQNTQAKYDVLVNELNVTKRRHRVQEGWHNGIYTHSEYLMYQMTPNPPDGTPMSPDDPRRLPPLKSKRASAPVGRNTSMMNRSLPPVTSVSRGYRNVHRPKPKPKPKRWCVNVILLCQRF